MSNIELHSLKANADKCISILKGILEGIKADDIINQEELGELGLWCENHPDFLRTRMLSQLVEGVDELITTNNPEMDDVDNLLEMCDYFLENINKLQAITIEIEEFLGIVEGIVADGTINVMEVEFLRDWISKHTPIIDQFPFNVTLSLINKILVDGKLENSEIAELVAFFMQIVPIFNKEVHIRLKNIARRATTNIIFSDHETVRIPGKYFCFTGESPVFMRSELRKFVERFGGTFTNSISKKMDYLVLCSNGSINWAYEKFGRKLESTMNLMLIKPGIRIIREESFLKVCDQGLGNKYKELALELALKYAEEKDIPARYLPGATDIAQRESKKEENFTESIFHWQVLINVMVEILGEIKAKRYLNTQPIISPDDKDVSKSKDFIDLTLYLIRRRNTDNCTPDELGRLSELHTHFQKEIERQLSART